MASRTTTLVTIVLLAGAAATVLAMRKTDERKPAPPAADATPLLPAGIRAEGRVTTYPGATVDVGTETGGRIVRLLVQEEQTVHRGDLIAEFASDAERAALDEARARVAEAGADITFLSEDVKRFAALIQSGSTSRQALDKVQRDLDAATARRAVATASVERIEAQLAKHRIIAPIDGTVTARYVEQGETVQPGTPLLTIANLAQRRVEAEVDEFDAGRVKAGAPVTITAEGYDNQSWQGTVEVVPDVVVARHLQPQDPSRPSDTRVLIAKITLPANAPLKLGQRVEVSIATR
jgi:RND family efflux transporter MFP subunit